MSLQGLSRIQLLEAHETNTAQVAQLLQSAARKLADSKSDAVSLETRFDAAYGCIIQSCMTALWANGYRPSKSKPGHHQTMIQSLVHSLDLDNDEVRLLGTFRIKRNVIDYSGDIVDEGSLLECISAAERLLQTLRSWLAEHRPDLVP